MKGKGKKAGARPPPVRVLSRPARSLDSKAAHKIFDAALKKILGPGVQRRIAADAAMPVRFPGDDGIYFDPNWQDDIIAAKPMPKKKQE